MLAIAMLAKSAFAYVDLDENAMKIALRHVFPPEASCSVSREVGPSCNLTKGLFEIGTSRDLISGGYSLSFRWKAGWKQEDWLYSHDLAIKFANEFGFSAAQAEACLSVLTGDQSGKNQSIKNEKYKIMCTSYTGSLYLNLYPNNDF